MAGIYDFHVAFANALTQAKQMKQEARAQQALERFRGQQLELQRDQLAAQLEQYAFENKMAQGRMDIERSRERREEDTYQYNTSRRGLREDMEELQYEAARRQVDRTEPLRDFLSPDYIAGLSEDSQRLIRMGATIDDYKDILSEENATKRANAALGIQKAYLERTLANEERARNILLNRLGAMDLPNEVMARGEQEGLFGEQRTAPKKVGFGETFGAWASYLGRGFGELGGKLYRGLTGEYDSLSDIPESSPTLVSKRREYLSKSKAFGEEFLPGSEREQVRENVHISNIENLLRRAQARTALTARTGVERGYEPEVALELANNARPLALQDLMEAEAGLRYVESDEQRDRLSAMIRANLKQYGINRPRPYDE